MNAMIINHRRIYWAALAFMLCAALPAVPQARKTKPRPGALPTPSAPAPVAEGTTVRLPPGYKGQSVAAILAALEAARPQLKKSEFETTMEYKERVARLGRLIPGVSSRVTFVLLLPNAKYDADAGSFLVKPYEDDPGLSLEYMDGYDSYSFTQTSYPVYLNTRTVGSFVGSNAFGMKRKIWVTATTEVRLAVPKDSVRALSRGLLVPATPQEARAVYSSLKVALTGRIVPPYGGSWQRAGRATMSDPEENHAQIYYVYFEPDTAVVFDSQTGDVLGGVDLMEKLPSARYGEEEKPVTVVEPSERLRLQGGKEDSEQGTGVIVELEGPRAEARRAPAPSDDPRLLDSAAVITSKPQPAMTEQARAAKLSGKVRLRVLLKEDGTVEVLSVIQGLPSGLTESAVAAAKQMRFKPATRAGRPAPQELTVEYTFY